MNKLVNLLKEFVFLSTILSTLLSTLMSSAFAAQINLYQAMFPVNTQSESERSAAIKQGMEQVLTKLTGNAAIANQSKVKPNIANAANFVQEYTYLPDADKKDHFQLQIRYNKADIDGLLNSANITYWGGQRPLVIVWLTSTDERGVTNVISDDSLSKLQNQIKTQARVVGIPLVFPMMDMTDVSLIAVQDVKTVNMSLLKEAGKRYEPDAYLVASIETKDAAFTSEWHFMLNDKRWDWSVNEKSMDKLLDSALDHLTQLLVKQYADKTQTKTKTTQWVKLDVSDITSTQDLDKLTAYLKQITLVKQVQLDQVAGDTVQLSVMLSGSLDAFMQNAVVGRHLVLADSSSPNLTFHWVR